MRNAEGWPGESVLRVSTGTACFRKTTTPSSTRITRAIFTWINNCLQGSNLSAYPWSSPSERRPSPSSGCVGTLTNSSNSCASPLPRIRGWMSMLTGKIRGRGDGFCDSRAKVSGKPISPPSGSSGPLLENVDLDFDATNEVADEDYDDDESDEGSDSEDEENDDDAAYEEREDEIADEDDGGDGD